MQFSLKIYLKISFLTNINTFASSPEYLSHALISVFLTKLTETKVIKELEPQCEIIYDKGGKNIQ